MPHLDEVVQYKGRPEDEGEDDRPVAHVPTLFILRRGFHVEGELGEEEEDFEADAHDQLDAEEGKVGLRGQRGLGGIRDGLRVAEAKAEIIF